MRPRSRQPALITTPTSPLSPPLASIARTARPEGMPYARSPSITSELSNAPSFLSSDPAPSLRSRFSGARLLSAPSPSAKPPARPSLKPKPSFKRLFKRGAGYSCPPPAWPSEPCYYEAPLPTRSRSSNAIPTVTRTSTESTRPSLGGERRKRSSTVMSFTSLISFNSSTSPLARSMSIFSTHSSSTPNLSPVTSEFGVRQMGEAQIAVDYVDDEDATIKAKSRARQRSAPVDVERPGTSGSTLTPLTSVFPSPPPSLSSTASSSPSSLATDFLPRSFTMESCETGGSIYADCEDREEVTIMDDEEADTTALYVGQGRRVGSMESLIDPFLARLGVSVIVTCASAVEASHSDA